MRNTRSLSFKSISIVQSTDQDSEKKIISSGTIYFYIDVLITVAAYDSSYLKFFLLIAI